MEFWKIFLMVVGAITCLWLIVKAIKGALLLLGNAFEAGFRNQFPLDYMFSLSWVINEMKQHGYAETATIDEGCENPGLEMRNENGKEMIINLHAPLSPDDKKVIVVTDNAQCVSITLPTSESGTGKLLLRHFIEACESQMSEEKKETTDNNQEEETSPADPD